jgi:hypothetical protein
MLIKHPKKQKYLRLLVDEGEKKELITASVWDVLCNHGLGTYILQVFKKCLYSLAHVLSTLACVSAELL